MNIKSIIKQCIKESIQESKNADPTKEEMLAYLESIYSGLLDKSSFDEAAEVAIYWFSNHYHGGQNSNLYSVLSTSEFSPGPISNGPEPESMEEDMYTALEKEFGNSTNENPDDIDEGLFDQPHKMEIVIKKEQGGITVTPFNPIGDIAGGGLLRFSYGPEEYHKAVQMANHLKRRYPSYVMNDLIKGNPHDSEYSHAPEMRVRSDEPQSVNEGFDPWSNGSGPNLDSYESQNAKMRKLEEDDDSDTIPGRFVDRGEIKLKGGISQDLADKIANYHWDVIQSLGKDERGVFNYKTRGDRWCCSVGLFNNEPAILSITTTPGRLNLLTGKEAIPNEPSTLEEDDTEIKHHCGDCGKEVSHPSKPGSCKVLCQDCLEVSQHIKDEGMEVEGMGLESVDNYRTCKGCGRVVDKEQDKCPKCRETQDKTSLPPKRMSKGAKRPSDAYGNFNVAAKGGAVVNEAGPIKPNRLSTPEKNKIGNALRQIGLDGNRRFESPSAGIGPLANALSEVGFQLDMVTGLSSASPDKGNQLLSFRRKNIEGQDTFTEQPTIENSRISYSWENLSGQGQPKRFEILAYPS